MKKKLLIAIIAVVVVAGAIVGGVLLFKHKHTEVVDEAVAPVTDEYFPAAHFVQLPDPAAEYVPAGHV